VLLHSRSEGGDEEKEPGIETRSLVTILTELTWLPVKSCKYT